MLEEYCFAGFGGQGVLMLGRVQAQAAMEHGLNATWLPSYGPEMRGGTANCIVVFSDEEIGSPVAATYDAVIVMNQPSLEKFEPRVTPGGTLLVNRSMITVAARRDDIDVHAISANDLAESAAGTMRAANIVMLGALHHLRPQLPLASLESALRAAFAHKSAEILDANHRALHAGIDAAQPRPTPAS